MCTEASSKVDVCLMKGCIASASAFLQVHGQIKPTNDLLLTLCFISIQLFKHSQLTWWIVLINGYCFYVAFVFSGLRGGGSRCQISAHSPTTVVPLNSCSALIGRRLVAARSLARQAGDSYMYLMPEPVPCFLDLIMTHPSEQIKWLLDDWQRSEDQRGVVCKIQCDFEKEFLLEALADTVIWHIWQRLPLAVV